MLSSLTEQYFCCLTNQTFINHLIDQHTPHFSDINTLLFEETECLDVIISAIKQLTFSHPDQQIVELLMEKDSSAEESLMRNNSIIENLFSIWGQLDYLILEIFSIFTQILESFTEFIRPFFIENDIFPHLCPFLKEFSNSEASFVLS